MKRKAAKALWCLVILGTVTSTAMATDGMLNWAFQNTGFQGTGETALAMRDGDTWPVIFSASNSYPYSFSVQAYSLYPVLNQQTGSNWFQVGTNLLSCPPAAQHYLSAATSPDGSFGAVVRTYGDPNPMDNEAIIGSSATGFGHVMPGVRAISFSPSGTLYTATTSTVPSAPYLSAIAAMPNGDLAAVDENGTYYQSGALLGGWQSQNALGPYGWPSYTGLAVDTLSRPHVVSLLGGELVASEFNIATGQWTPQILAGCGLGASVPTIAADGKGGVGVAWVQANPANTAYGELEYAYNNGSGSWAVHTVATSVFDPLAFANETLLLTQTVGLAFDPNNCPVISFCAGPPSGPTCWMAYDPATVPEPSTLVLLASGLLGLVAYAWRRRTRAS